MTWLFAALVVLALGGVALVAAGRGGSLPEARDDRPAMRLPAGRLGAADLRRVRFPLAVRGYRMAEVDALLARLADQLEQGHGADPEDPRGSGHGGRPEERLDDRVEDRHGGRDGGRRGRDGAD